MSRTLWFAAGAGATVYAMNKARRLRETFTLDGLRDRANGIVAGARVFREEVAQGSADKEIELRDRLGLVPHGTPELESPGGRHRLGAGTQDPPRLTTTQNLSGTNQEGTN